MSSARSSSMHIGPLGEWRQPRSQVITITPDQAKAILDNHNPNNRRKDKRHAQRIANAIKLGHWQLNGESIILGWDGTLLDGQHRLWACVMANIPISTWVVFGVEPGCFQTIDQQARKRSYADLLEMDGHAYSNHIAAAVALLHNWEKGVRSQMVLTNSGDTHQLASVLERHSGIVESTVFACKSDIRYLVARRITSVTHYLFGQRDSEMRDEFFDRLILGDGMTLGNPVLALRERLYRDNVSNRVSNKVPLKAFQQFHMFIRTWNHVRAGTSVTKIQVPTKEIAGKVVYDDLPDIK